MMPVLFQPIRQLVSLALTLVIDYPLKTTPNIRTEILFY